MKIVEVKREFEKKVAESGDNGGDEWNRYRNGVLEVADEFCGWTTGICRHGETW